MPISFDAQLKNTAREVRQLVYQVRKGNPRTTVMGYLYPEQLDKFLDHATPNQIEHAIADLKRSEVMYNDIARFLREGAVMMDELASTLEARDTFVDIDIARMQEIAEEKRR
jgi:hypothetical protein